MAETNSVKYFMPQVKILQHHILARIFYIGPFHSGKSLTPFHLSPAGRVRWLGWHHHPDSDLHRFRNSRWSHPPSDHPHSGHGPIHSEVSQSVLHFVAVLKVFLQWMGLVVLINLYFQIAYIYLVHSCSSLTCSKPTSTSKSGHERVNAVSTYL